MLGTDFRGKGRDKVTSEKMLEHHIEVIQLRDEGAPRPGGWPRRGQTWLDSRQILKEEPQIFLAAWLVWGGDEEKRKVQANAKVVSLSSWNTISWMGEPERRASCEFRNWDVALCEA